MLITDLIHSCSNEKVAQAAVACIGGSFAQRVAMAADVTGLNTGRYVSSVVRHFAHRATIEARSALQQKITGTDQPLLYALRHVVEDAMDQGLRIFDDGEDDCIHAGVTPGAVICAGLTPLQ